MQKFSAYFCFLTFAFRVDLGWSRMRLNLGDPPAATVHRRSTTIVAAVLVLGVVAWFALISMSRKTREGVGWPLASTGLAAAITAVPSARRRIATLIDSIREPSRSTRWKIALAIALAATLYLLFTAIHQGRDLTAKEQDESMYLIQAQMLARGRLSMPPHPHGEF